MVGICFWALSNPIQENKKSAMKWSGISSLVALLAGFGLIAKIKVGFPLWILVKLVCWLLLTGLVAVAYKKPENKKQILFLVIFLFSLAVTMVSLKPF